ncbi:tyrosine-protein phosphatase [Pseudomonas tohonis]|uniref:tyrosine-protein phosphatase n=1 Tax=Pseudomonas tohonis TaxID=2725477 RepID=UPI001F1A4243|nr:tyrosine-protein phosphatase [Pseudomonas tohonis]
MTRICLVFSFALFCGLAQATTLPLARDLPAAEREAQRLFALPSVPNLRDLGGYRTADGRTVKWGLLYRAGTLDALEEADQRELQRLQLRRLVDLRSRQEIDDAPDRLPPELAALRVEMPVRAGTIDVRELSRRINGGDVGDLRLDDLLVDANRSFVREHRQVFSDWLHGLLDEQGTPVLYHCTAGKDRTGFASAILLLALGVPEGTVMQDYLASNPYLEDRNRRIGERVRQASAGRTDPAILQPLLEVRPRYLQAALQAMREDYGTVEGFLRDGLGIDDDLRARLRERFLEPLASR